MEFTFDCGGVLFAFGFVAEVFDVADEIFEFAIWDLIGEGVDDDVLIFDEGNVEDGVFGVAGEAGVIPEEESTWAFGLGEVVVDHAFEVFATDNGFAAAGIFVDLAQDQLMGLAVCLHFSELAVD